MARRCSACNEYDVVCKRPDVCLSAFTIIMADGCGDFAVVPQRFKDRLNDFAENFLVVVDCHGFKYDVHIQIGNDATLLCGAYWRLFAKTHKLKAGDSVYFSAAEYGAAFKAMLVGQADDVVLDAKLFGLQEVSHDVRNRFHSTVFKNMADLTDREVRKVLTALAAGLDEDIEFEREFIAQKFTDLDMASGVLVIPCKSKNVLRLPFSGHVNFNSNKLSKFMDGTYTTTTSGDVVIYQGWKEFCGRHRIRTGSVLLFEVDSACDLFLQVKIIKR